MMQPFGKQQAAPPSDRPHVCPLCGGWPAPILVVDNQRLCETCAAEAVD
jgi:hypothetical protein